MTAPRLGLLFASDWDTLGFGRLVASFDFDAAGFDLFAFPSNVGLAFYDPSRFVRQQAARALRRGWAGVVSEQEHFGALAAALVAERLGLPGNRPEAVLAAQHKLYARQVLQRVAPEANLGFTSLDIDYGDDVPDGLVYPAFVKPVKAAFSVLARQVADRGELQAHTRFGAAELWLIRHLVEPFERVRRERLPEAGSAHRMLLEEPVPAGTPQFNLDGWVWDGQVHLLGVVDAISYPGTQAFMRWELPSRLGAAVQQRALAVAEKFLAATGFRQGFFNMEFFFDARSDRLAVIEFNPRLAAQFSDLYRRTLGLDPHAMSVAMALGRDPLTLPRAAATAGVAASFIYRAFDAAAVPAQPRAAQAAAFAQALPDALLRQYPKQGAALARDFKWLDCTCYGIVNLGGRDAQQLRDNGLRASALLGWAAPYADQSDQAANDEPCDPTNPLPAPARAAWAGPTYPFPGVPR